LGHSKTLRLDEIAVEGILRWAAACRRIMLSAESALVYASSLLVPNRGADGMCRAGLSHLYMRQTPRENKRGGLVLDKDAGVICLSVLFCFIFFLPSSKISHDETSRPGILRSKIMRQTKILNLLCRLLDYNFDVHVPTFVCFCSFCFFFFFPVYLHLLAMARGGQGRSFEPGPDDKTLLKRRDMVEGTD
jgi:hypothetical protein